MTDRAERIVAATMEYTLRPKSGDRPLVIAAALQWLVDNCACVDECSYSIAAGEVEDIVKELIELARYPKLKKIK